MAQEAVYNQDCFVDDQLTIHSGGQTTPTFPHRMDHLSVDEIYEEAIKCK